MKLKSFLAGVVVGTVAGGVAVALTTPKRGAELRDDIKKEYDIAKEKANEYKESMDIKLDEYKEKVELYKEELKEKMSKEELAKFLQKNDSSQTQDLEELEKTLDDLSEFDE